MPLEIQAIRLDSGNYMIKVPEPDSPLHSGKILKCSIEYLYPPLIRRLIRPLLKVFAGRLLSHERARLLSGHMMTRRYRMTVHTSMAKTT